MFSSWFAIRQRSSRRPAAVFAVVALIGVAARANADDPRLATTPAVQQVQGELSALLVGLSAETHVGLVVEDLREGTRWFAHQPRRALMPASVMKLFVTAAALERFGPQFRYETRVYVSGDELWVIGAGDPGLGDARIARRRVGQSPTLGERGAPKDVFAAWAAALHTRGVRTLRTIVLDDGVFDRQWRHPDWPVEQSQAWYQAPVGGLNYNDNCLDARINVPDGRVVLLLEPPLPPSFVRNFLRVANKHGPRVVRPPDSDIFEFHGTVSRLDELGPTSVRRPSVFFGHALRQSLETHGIRVTGQVVRRSILDSRFPIADRRLWPLPIVNRQSSIVNHRVTTEPSAPAEGTLLATHTTALEDVVWRCNTFSQNLFAECLLKSLAAYQPDGSRNGTAGSWDAGVQVLRSTLEGLGLDLCGAVFRDASGLSHRNRLTAETVVQLLVLMRRHRHGDVFRQSLAIPGEEGTLRRHFSDPRLRERLRGKTGTLDGVRALAGHVTRPDGTTLAFALLINGKSDPDLRWRVARILAGLNAGS